MSEVILDTLIDSIKLVPFLFLTYLAMEYLSIRLARRLHIWCVKQVKWDR